MQETDLDKFLDEQLAWAIETKIAEPGDDKFPMKVHIVGPGGQIARTPLGWRTQDEKYKAMDAASYAARMTNSRAVVLTSDMRYARMDEFADHFGMERPNSKTIGNFQKEYVRILDKDFGGTIANLPRHIWDEVLMVQAYGPRVKKWRATGYRFIGGVFTPSPSPMEQEAGDVLINIIRPWWV